VVTGPDGTFRVIHLLQEMQSRPAPALARRPGPASERPAEERAPITERPTHRELEVLRLFTADSTIDEIAGALTSTSCPSTAPREFAATSPSLPTTVTRRILGRPSTPVGDDLHALDGDQAVDDHRV
jgi:hypothetical protein